MKQLSVVLLLLAALAGHANAQRAWKPTPSLATKPAKRSEPMETRWYGWQVLAADAATTAGYFSLDLEQRDRNKLLLAGYLLAGPTVHALNRNADGAIKSVLLRGSLPFVAGLGVGLLAQDPWAFLGGGVAGMLIASGWDAFAIAHKETGQRAVREKAQPPRFLRAAPTNGGFIAGLGGTF